MAKVTITIEDVEGAERSVNMSYDFIPELPELTEEEQQKEDSTTMTPAQAMAMHVYKFLETSIVAADMQEGEEGEEESEEESCSQPEEGTCCGGACHTTEA
jgi:hypothetical protein